MNGTNGALNLIRSYEKHPTKNHPLLLPDRQHSLRLNLERFGPNAPGPLPDGFEKGTPGLSPRTNDPIVGTYILSDGAAAPFIPTVPTTNTMRIVTGPFPGGPDGAFSGNNYFMLDRINFQTANPVLQAVFASGLLAANTPFHAELRLWAAHLTGDNNYPQLIIGGNGNGNPISTSANTHLLYTSDVTRSAQWQWYNGSYTDSGLRFRPEFGIWSRWTGTEPP